MKGQQQTASMVEITGSRKEKEKKIRVLRGESLCISSRWRCTAIEGRAENRSSFVRASECAFLEEGELYANIMLGGRLKYLHPAVLAATEQPGYKSSVTASTDDLAPIKQCSESGRISSSPTLIPVTVSPSSVFHSRIIQASTSQRTPKNAG
jgi:hypothetical protein